jgi:endoglucanase
VPGRLVYSPHDYGPAVSAQAWFWDPRFPANLPAEWDRHWGYLAEEGIAPVVVGEFGGRSFGADRDGVWQLALIAYLRRHGFGAMVWSLNPNWDTGGIFTENWRGVDLARQAEYQQLLAAPLSLGPLGAFGLAPARYRVVFQQDSSDARGTDVVFTVQVVNDGPDTLNLSHFELRYWLAGADPPPGGPTSAAEPVPIKIETVDLPAEHVHADLVPVEPARAGQGYYLRIRFDPAAGSLDRYQGSGKVIIRLHRAALPPESPGDYSQAASPGLRQGLGEWGRVTLYLDGQLVAGEEPGG